MPVNPNIALGLEPQKPVDIMGAYGNALTIKNLVDQGKMQSLQLAQAQRESEKQMRLADVARMYGGDEERFGQEYAKVDPLGAREYGIKRDKAKVDILKSQLDTQKVQLDNAEKLNGLRLQSALAVRDAGYSPEAYAQQRARLATILPPELAATIPQMMSREEIDATINAGMSMADRIAQARLEWEKKRPPEGFTLNEQGQMVPIAAYWDQKRAVAREGKTDVRQFNNTKDNFQNELKLRSDFRAEPIYKAHQEIQVAYGQINKSLGMKSPAGDLAAATQIRKLMDPNSVVRETELQQVIDTQGLGDRLQNYVNMLMTGNKLTDAQRSDFRKLADSLFIESQKVYATKRGEYRRMASEYGLNPERAIGGGEPPREPTDAPSGRSQSSSPAVAAPGIGVKPGKPTAPASGGEFNLKSMPDPAQYKRRTIESKDGTLYQSDGKGWKRISSKKAPAGKP